MHRSHDCQWRVREHRQEDKTPACKKRELSMHSKEQVV